MTVNNVNDMFEKYIDKIFAAINLRKMSTELSHGTIGERLKALVMSFELESTLKIQVQFLGSGSPEREGLKGWNK